MGIISFSCRFLKDSSGGQRLTAALSVRARRFAWSDEVESYVGGSVATGWASLQASTVGNSFMIEP